ncbi:MAG: thiamine phosphate synthase [Planctomycetota bacterium]
MRNERHGERILDANGNRAAEGLRILEEVARFLLDDPTLSSEAKHCRHSLRQALPVSAVAARDNAGDVGTAISTSDEGLRPRLYDLIRANAARAQEALRCLEEFGKLLAIPQLPDAAEDIRYRSYRLEQALLARLPAERLWRERLYVLIDSGCCQDPLAVATAAARGGAGVIQLRAKHLSPRAYADLAAALLPAVRAAGALFIVNDHVAIAAAIGADGVHLGQDDITPGQARRVLGPLAIIGLSTHSPEQVAAAHRETVDYIGIGPMYATGTKAHEPVRGPGLLLRVAEQLRLPSYAIGGITPEHLAELRPPHGIAVAGCVCRAEDPARACALLRERIDAF